MILIHYQSLFIECVDDLLPTITKIMNVSLITGIVPQPFKHAIVRPLFKKPNLDPENLKNYRPVSNLSKVLERIVLKQLLAHIKLFDLLDRL